MKNIIQVIHSHEKRDSTNLPWWKTEFNAFIVMKNGIQLIYRDKKRDSTDLSWWETEFNGLTWLIHLILKDPSAKTSNS